MGGESNAFHASQLGIFISDVIRSGRRGRKDIIYAYIRKSDLPQQGCLIRMWGLLPDSS